MPQHLTSAATLDTVDFARLAIGDPSEVARLLQACRTPGFFYLDLQNLPTRQILEDFQNILPVIERYFDQPHEVKMRDFRAGEDRGYKPGVDESFEIALDEMNQNTLQLPPILDENLKLLENFTALSHYVTRTILSCLSDAVQLGGMDSFENSHRHGEPTNSALKLIYEPTQAKITDVIENKHTDYGTLTLLFGKQWGLHIEYPETKTWGYVEPRDGLAVINVADSLHRLSAKKFYSCTHRITQRDDGFQKRYYVVYLLRPESTISLEDK